MIQALCKCSVYLLKTVVLEVMLMVMVLDMMSHRESGGRMWTQSWRRVCKICYLEWVKISLATEDAQLWNK